MNDVVRALDEANFDEQTSVTSALRQASGLVPPRVAWLVGEIAGLKRAVWTEVASVTGTTLPPEALDLESLLAWEVRRAEALTPHELDLVVEYEGRRRTVAELLRLNGRRSVWYAGQIDALSRTRTA